MTKLGTIIPQVSPASCCSRLFPSLAGSPKWLRREIQRITCRRDGDEIPPPFQPISRTSWGRLYPKEITKEKWRSCCCGICTEAEAALDTWGRTMSVIHQTDPSKQKGGLSRKISLRCRSQDCCWASGRLKLPDPWPTRFKNIVASNAIGGEIARFLRAFDLICIPQTCWRPEFHHCFVLGVGVEPARRQRALHRLFPAGSFAE
jgi:hypothetical protein